MVQNLFCYRMYIYILLGLEQDSNFSGRTKIDFLLGGGEGETDPLGTLILYFTTFSRNKNKKP